MAARKNGTWAFSYGYTNFCSLAEFGRQAWKQAFTTESAESSNWRSFLQRTLAHTRAQWNGNFTPMLDRSTAEEPCPLYQDTYYFRQRLT